MPLKARPPPSFSSPSLYVDLSKRSFAVWWVILLAVHIVTGGYNGAYAMFYWELQYTYLYQCLNYAGIGMEAKSHHTIAVVNALMAALHGFCILLMIGGSIWQRELAFSPWRGGFAVHASRSSRRGSSNIVQGPKAADTNASWPRAQLVRLYSQIWGREGLFGVNGSNFHTLLIARELLETALQTVQAYRMSWYLPRILLNRFYVLLLVINCWSSVFVYSLLFQRNEARRRYASVVLDCILDVVSCIGVPLIIVISYAGQYDPKITGFAMEKWYDDTWTANVVNELRMVVVTSWSDLASKTVFSLGVLFSTTSLKELLRTAPGSSKRRIACAADSVRYPSTREGRTNAGPKISGVIPAQETHKRVKFGGSYSDTGIRTLGGRVLLRVVHLLFGAWGIAVLGLHIQASVQPELPQCVLQVRPWATTEPACYLAVLDCYHFGITGTVDEVETKWAEFDKSTVVKLVFRHCAALEIPDTINNFHLVQGIKAYNSTILSWNASAAITNTHHPELVWLYLVRVNMTDGVLPAGLQLSDCPRKLYDIEFCHTNLRELPEDLDSKWLIGTMIYIEYSQLTSVPLALTRLDPYYLALTGNPISELPPEIFEIPDMLYLGIGSTNITELPRNVTNLSPLLSFIYLTDTNISFFWPWIDPLVKKKLDGARPLLMGSSEYCKELAKITSGEADAFNVTPSPEYSMYLTDPSEANRGVILHTVNCEIEYAAPFYPLALEDNNSAIPLT